jgi:hypothetical protein
MTTALGSTTKSMPQIVLDLLYTLCYVVIMEKEREMSTEEYAFNVMFPKYDAEQVMAAFMVIGMVIVLPIYALFKWLT